MRTGHGQGDDGIEWKIREKQRQSVGETERLKRKRRALEKNKQKKRETLYKRETQNFDLKKQRRY